MRVAFVLLERSLRLHECSFLPPSHRWVASGPMPRDREFVRGRRSSRSSSLHRLRHKVAAAASSRTTSERGLLPKDGLELSAVELKRECRDHKMKVVGCVLCEIVAENFCNT